MRRYIADDSTELIIYLFRKYSIVNSSFMHIWSHDVWTFIIIALIALLSGAMEIYGITLGFWYFLIRYYVSCSREGKSTNCIQCFTNVSLCSEEQLNIP